MTPRELVLAQLRHEETPVIPATLAVDPEMTEKLDAYYGDDRWKEMVPRAIVGCSCVDADRNEPAGEGVERDAFGTLWRVDRRPRHHEKPGLAEPTFTGYDFPSPGRFLDAERFEQASRVAEAHPDAFRVAGFGWGLFERSWTIRGFENALMDAIAEPDFYEELLDRITELHLAFIRESVKLPVDGIMFSDDWGDQRGVILGPDRWRRMLKPRLARLYQAVHDAGKVTLSHCCGCVTEIVPDLIEIGLDVLESLQPEAMDIYDLKARYGDRISLWGGLGSQSTIPFGTPADIWRETKRLCTEMGRGGGYILAPAKSLQPETPTENAVACIESFSSQDWSRMPEEPVSAEG